MVKTSLVYVCDDKRHLICYPYSVDNLHQMAEDLNIKKCWFHGGKHPHYDIPKKRITEIKSLCLNRSTREILQLINQKI